MNLEEINKLLNQIIENSKFKDLVPEQKETLKKKIIQKYVNDFNLIALEMLDKNLQNEFSKILANSNQEEIDSFIANNISDIDLITKKAAEKFSKDLILLLA